MSIVEKIQFTYLVGVGVTHSVAPPMHNQVAKGLGLSWEFKAQECPSIEHVMDLFRDKTFAGGVVTMPYKITIMQHLDGLDDHAQVIGACNNVYKTENGSLRGTNTDWRGIQGCLESGTPSGTGIEGQRKPAIIIGAGGAARAAVYALHHRFKCSPIYVANRDEGEIQALLRDAQTFENLEIIPLTNITSTERMTQERGYPYFIVGTVPDFEPQSASELEVRAILEYCFMNSSEKGVLLDMCFKPRITRIVKLANSHSWKTVEGVDVIGHQIHEQYRLWTSASDKEVITPQIESEAWKALHYAADKSTAINF